MKVIFENNWSDIDVNSGYKVSNYSVTKYPIKLQMHNLVKDELIGTSLHNNLVDYLMDLPFSLAGFRNVSLAIPKVGRIINYSVNSRGNNDVKLLLDNISFEELLADGGNEEDGEEDCEEELIV
jgi:hypothetical protein